jgi:hypothetical protein
MVGILLIAYSVGLIWLQTKAVDLTLSCLQKEDYGLFSQLTLFSALWTQFVIVGQSNDVGRLIPNIHQETGWRNFIIININHSLKIYGSWYHIILFIATLVFCGSFLVAITICLISILSPYPASILEVEFYAKNLLMYVFRALIKPLLYLLTLILTINYNSQPGIQVMTALCLFVTLIDFLFCMFTRGVVFGATRSINVNKDNVLSALTEISSSNLERLVSVLNPDKIFAGELAVCNQLKTGMFTILKPISRKIWTASLAMSNNVSILRLRLMVLSSLIIFCFIPQQKIANAFHEIYLPNIAQLAGQHSRLIVLVTVCAFASKKELASLIINKQDRILLVANVSSSLIGGVLIFYAVKFGQISAVLLAVSMKFLTHRIIVSLAAWYLYKTSSLDLVVCCVVLFISNL